MKRKVLVFFFALFLLFFMPRCTGKVYYTIVGIDLDFIEYISRNTSRSVSYLNVWKQEVTIRVNVQREWEDSHAVAAILDNLSMIQSCIAWQEEEIARNRLLLETSILMFDTGVIVNNTKIPARTDLLTHPVFEKMVEKWKSGDEIQIRFNIDQIYFEEETFDVYFECQTSDNRNLSAQKTATIDLSKVLPQD